jgi:hypothetical protein
MSAFGSESGNDFLAYARMQHELGLELVERHVAEATGCCRACGRPFPCDGHENGRHMQAHYEMWLTAEHTT